MERKYVAFISYRHAELDSAVAKQLHTLIERYVIPKKLRKDGGKKLGIVFRDQEELPVSSDLSDDICRALDNAQYLIVVCTKNTAQSPWVGREISYFLSHHDRSCAFAALADGEPSEVFPLSLTQIQNPDGTVTDVEPLAIDLRAKNIPAMKKKAKREITRLFAALIGCPYDSLVMREQRRKRRQLVSIMAVILAIITSFSAMTLAKNYEIDQKNEELAGMNQTLEGKNLELEEKNNELARQKAEVQLRESELLTEKALTYLTEENTQKAMENALAALPSAIDDRPYYALAEQVLTSSMGIYEDSKDDYEIFSTVLEQKTPISCYEISSDGTRIMTLDAYGLVTCFDVETTEILWTTQVSNSDGVDHIQMFGDTAADGVVVNFEKDIAAVDWENGEILWQNTKADDARLILSPDGKTLGCRKQEMQSNLVYYDYAFEFFSAETGEVIQSIDIGTTAVWGSNEEGLSTWTFEDFINSEYEIGAFSSDGRYFVTNFVEQWDSSGKKERCYLLMDLVDGTCRELYRREIDETNSLEKVKFLYFTADDSAVVAALDPNTNVAYQVEKIDVQTGKRLWKTDTGLAETFFWSGDPMQAHRGVNTLFLSRGGNFYTMDLETGEHVHTLTAQDNEIVFLEFVDNLFFGLVFSDGSYTLGWANDSGIYTSDSYFGPYLDIGTAVNAKMWNGGIVRMIVADDRIQGTHVGTADDPNGYIVSMPQEESHTLEVKRAVDFGSLLEKTTLTLAPEEEGYLFDAYVRDVGSDAFVLGRYSVEIGEESKYSYRLINRETNQVTELALPSYEDIKYTSFLSDGSGCITTDYADGILRYSADGEETVLMENIVTPYPEVPELNYYTYSFGTRTQADGRLLTVALGDGKLIWFYDGKDRQEVEIPTDIRYQHVGRASTYRFLSVGENGIILIANYADEETMRFQSFAAYDIQKDTWYRFGEDGTSTGFAGVAPKNPWLLLLNDTNTVYIYDIPTDKLLYQFPLQLPLNSVEEIGLVLDNTYLAVKTGDMQVLLYDITNGQIVYSTQLDGYSEGTLHVEEDTQNGRVYIWEDGSYRDDGICVDKESWTELARISGMLYYDPLRNKLYCYHSHASEEGEGGIVFSPPSLEELVKMGETIISE